MHLQKIDTILLYIVNLIPGRALPISYVISTEGRNLVPPKHQKISRFTRNDRIDTLCKEFSPGIQRETIITPQASCFIACFYPLGAVAINIVFCKLDRSNNFDLFHSLGMYAHTFGHSPNLIKIHGVPPQALISF
jgi:hypothetical protein